MKHALVSLAMLLTLLGWQGPAAAGARSLADSSTTVLVLGPQSIAVPLYPGATPSGQPYFTVGKASTQSPFPYLLPPLHAWVEYLAAAVAPRAVLTWYERAFPALGYVRTSTGWSGNLAGGDCAPNAAICTQPSTPGQSVIWSSFQPPQATETSPSIRVSCEDLGDGDTLFEVSVTILQRPVRDPASYIPAGIGDVHATAQVMTGTVLLRGNGPDGQPVVWHTTTLKAETKDPARIAALVRALNDLQRPVQVNQNFGGAINEPQVSVTLRLQPVSASSPITVTASSPADHVTIGSYPVLLYSAELHQVLRTMLGPGLDAT
jgi:hypothetical protein